MPKEAVNETAHAQHKLLALCAISRGIDLLVKKFI
jgi:hypothetical protein